MNTKSENPINVKQRTAVVRDLAMRMKQKDYEAIRGNYYKAMDGLKSLAHALEMADLDMGSPNDAILIDEHLLVCEALSAMNATVLGKVL
jgi:hypothetical protein